MKTTDGTSFKYGELYYYAEAAEIIDAYKLIALNSEGKVILADNSTISAIGMSTADANIGDYVKFVTSGDVTNKNWIFDYPLDKILFLDSFGNFSPTINTTYIIQRIGTIVSPNTIQLNLASVIIMNPTATPVYITPTPSSTPSISPTPTITPTVTPTHTT